MRKIRQVLRLANTTTLSLRAMASSLGISRDSVHDYILRSKAVGLSWPLPENLDDAELEAKLFPTAMLKLKRKDEPDWALVHQELKRKGATLLALHEEYLEANPDGLRRTQFCERYRQWRKGLKRYLRQTHVAGERVFVDYAGPTLQIYDLQTGEAQKAQVFVGVMGCSNYTYAEVHWSQKLPDWIAAHGRMFEFFGAVPQVIVCDNLKSGVTKASKTDPELNVTYQSMAEHYGCTVIPARPRKPGDKAKVENGVLVVERWILFRLRHRRFTSLGEAQAAVAELLQDLNSRPFQKMPGCRQTTFDSLDRPAMNALPAQTYEYVEFRRVRVGPDGMIFVDERMYSVPYVLARQNVELRLTAALIEVLHAGRRVGSLVRAPGTTPMVNPDHLSPNHRYFATWQPQVELDWARTIGLNVHAFLESRLIECNFKEQGYRFAAGLKKIEREFGGQRLDDACKLAMHHGARSLKNIRSILQHGLESMQPAGSVQEAAFEHPNIRGPGYYH